MEVLWIVILAAVLFAFVALVRRGRATRVYEERKQSNKAVPPPAASAPALPLSEDEVYAQEAAAVAAERERERQAVERAHKEQMVPIQEKLDRARRLVSEARVDTAACDILKIMWHWASWSKRDDWRMPLAVDGLEGGDIQSDKGVSRTGKWLAWVRQEMQFKLQLDFSYSFSDEPMGTIKLWVNGEHVLTLDVSQNIQSEYDSWRSFGVSAFRAGPWMAHVADFAGQLRAADEKRRIEYEHTFYRNKADQIDL